MYFSRFNLLLSPTVWGKILYLYISSVYLCSEGADLTSRKRHRRDAKYSRVLNKHTCRLLDKWKIILSILFSHNKQKRPTYLHFFRPCKFQQSTHLRLFGNMSLFGSLEYILWCFIQNLHDFHWPRDHSPVYIEVKSLSEVEFTFFDANV